MDKKRLLITGISGMLGNNMAHVLQEHYDILGLYHQHPVNIKGIQTQEIDLFDPEQIKEVVASFKPEIIIHCAAISDVDQSEINQPLATKINVDGTKNIVQAVKGSGIKLVYICTDLIYGESNGALLSEKSKVDPANHYGKTKYLAEVEVLKHSNALSVRTNIFGWNIQPKRSLAEWMVEELRNHRSIKGFQDVHFSGIYTFDLARLLEKAIKKDLRGIYNFASRDSMTKYDFACRIADLFQLDRSLIQASSIDTFKLAAPRRKNLALDITKLEGDLGIKAPTMAETTQRFFDDFKRNIMQKIRANIYPILDIIPYGRQSIDDSDIQAVVEILKSDTITQGTNVDKFQDALCKVTQATYAVAVNSGTSALHIACLAAGIGPGDEAITSPNTFVASANCVAYCGATPVFADINPKTYNISPQEIEKKINERTKAVIPVHFAGQSCAMEEIQKIVESAQKRYGHKIYIIEDASHALKSQYKATQVGSCAYSDMTVMSFHPVKHITTGEGGVVFTNDKQLQRKLSVFRSHGITNDPGELIYKENAYENGQQTNPSMRKIWYYEQQFLGYNYRITDIQCALGISQLKKLGQFSKRRRQIVDQYNSAFKNMPFVTVPFEESLCNSNFHLYVLRFDFKEIGMPRAQFWAELKKNKIQTQVHYIPVHTQPFYRQHFGTKWGDCPVAEHYYEQCLSIPLHPQMTADDIDKVILNIKRLVARSATSGV